MPADDTGKHDVDEAAATQQRAASKLGTSARQPSPLKPRPSSARGIPAAPYVDDEELIEEMQTLMSPITDEVQACDVELVDDTVASFGGSPENEIGGTDLNEPAPIDPPTIQHTKLRPSAPAMRRASQSMHAMPASVRASMPSRPPLPSQISSPPASASRPLPPRRTMPSELPISERQPAAQPIPPSGLRASSPDHADVAPTSRQGRQPRPSQHPTSRPPPLSPPHIGAFDETEAAMTMPASSAMRVGFPAPQFSAPRAPQPFVPTAPITRKLVDDEPGDRDSVEPDRPFHVRPELAPSKPPPFTFKLTGDLDLPPTSRRPATLPTLSELDHIGPTTALAHPPVRLAPQATALFGKNESPSLAPVAMGPPSRGVADMTAQLRPMRTGFGDMKSARAPWLIAGLAFVVGTALAGSVLAFVALSPRKAKTTSVAAATHDAKQPAAPSTVVVAPTTTYVPIIAPSGSAMPSAMPSATVPPVKLDVPPVIEADQTLVTFPASAKGHRVFVDGRPYAAVGDEPTPIRCGKHKIQIGSSGKPQPVVLPCGSELTIE